MPDGFADVFQMSVLFGWTTWASRLMRVYSEVLVAIDGDRITDALPPWQSSQPACTPPACALFSSGLWHVRQPADLRFTSAVDCRRRSVAAADAAAGAAEPCPP